MGHAFSKWFDDSMLGEEEAGSEQQGGGGQNPNTKNIFPNPPTAEKPFGSPEYSKSKASSAVSPFDTSTNRYGQEGALTPAHF